jgi:hypothetical protein
LRFGPAFETKFCHKNQTFRIRTTGTQKEWNNAEAQPEGEGNGLASKRLQELQHQVFSAEMK